MPEELLNKNGEKDGKIDVPPPPPSRKAPGDPKNAVEFVEWLIKTVGTATIGHQVLDRYALSFKLKDDHPFLFRLFLGFAYTIDVVLAIVLMLVIVTLIIGIAYSILRGLNVVDQVGDILKAILDYPRQLFGPEHSVSQS